MTVAASAAVFGYTVQDYAWRRPEVFALASNGKSAQARIIKYHAAPKGDPYAKVDWTDVAGDPHTAQVRIGSDIRAKLEHEAGTQWIGPQNNISIAILFDPERPDVVPIAAEDIERMKRLYGPFGLIVPVMCCWMGIVIGFAFIYEARKPN